MKRSVAALVLAGGLVGGAAASLGMRTAVSARMREIATIPSPAVDGIVRSALDPSVQACTDFYAHACGGFAAATKVTEAAPSIRMASNEFERNLDRNLARLFAQDDYGDRELARLKTFYDSCLRGDSPADIALVRGWLDRIDAVGTPAELQTVIRDLSSFGVDVFISYSGRPDRTKTTRYRGEIHSSVAWADIPTITRAFTDAGQSPSAAASDASSVAAIAATLQNKRADRYDAQTAEHPVLPSALRKVAPTFAWGEYLRLVAAPERRTINITSPEYLRAVDVQLRTRGLAALKAYLRWSFLLSLRGELPSPYRGAFADIEPSMRVKTDPAGRCRDATVRAMGVEFSRQYAKRILGWQAREAARRIAEDIKRTIVASIANDTWLSASARRATARKLAATDLKIGFPDICPRSATSRFPRTASSKTSWRRGPLSSIVRGPVQDSADPGMHGR